MLKVIPALEGYVLANIATQNIFGTNPINFLLGDLNATVPSGANALQRAMGPNHQGISLKELLTGEMSGTRSYQTGPSSGTFTQTYSVGGVLEEVQSNFMDNLGTLLVSTTLSTAGFRIAKKVLRKPINMANRTLRNTGLGSTIQF